MKATADLHAQINEEEPSNSPCDEVTIDALPLAAVAARLPRRQRRRGWIALAAGCGEREGHLQLEERRRILPVASRRHLNGAAGWYAAICRLRMGTMRELGCYY